MQLDHLLRRSPGLLGGQVGDFASALSESTAYDGTHWSDPVNLEDEPFGSFVLPACPTATFCVAISPFSASAYIGTP